MKNAALRRGFSYLSNRVLGWCLWGPVDHLSDRPRKTPTSGNGSCGLIRLAIDRSDFGAGWSSPVARQAHNLNMSVVKNEARHIQDWLRFHAQAGVTDFFIYDDGSDDDTVARARALVGVNVVVVPWRMTGSFRKPQAHFSRQVLAYAHALENFGPAFRWMAFVDVDEYIVPQEAATIAEALAPLDGVTNVSLPWTMFGPNGHVDRPAVPDPFAYTTRAAVRADAILNFKCIVDPCDVSEVRIHRFQTRSLLDRTSNDIGQLSDNARRAGDFLSNSSLQLNHYFTRSDADLAEKFCAARGFTRRVIFAS